MKGTKTAEELEKSADTLCQDVVGMLKNNRSVEQWRQAMKIIHGMFAKEEDNPIVEMINFGLVSFLVEGLNCDEEEVQYSCVTALNEIVVRRCEDTSKIAESGAVPPLIALMKSANFDLAEDATLIVAKIAGESAMLRDIVIQSNAMDELTTLSGKLKALPLSFVRVISEAFEEICCHVDSQVSLEVLEVILQGLLHLLRFKDHKVCKGVLVALRDITNSSDDNGLNQKHLVRDSGIFPLAFKHINDEYDDLVEPLLRVLINISAGDDSLKQFVINLETLQKLPKIMVNKAKNHVIIKHCCKLVGNVTAGTSDQEHRTLVRDSGVLPLIFEYISDDNGDLVLQALNVLINISADEDSLRQSIIDLGALPVLREILEKKADNSEIIKNCCTLLRNVARGTDDQLTLVRDSGVLPLVFKYISDDNDELVKEAFDVLINIACDDVWGEQFVVDLGVLQELPGIMEKKANNSEIITLCCMLIHYAMAGSNDRKKLVSDSGVLPLVVKYFNHDHDDLVIEALVVLIVISSGDNSLRQSIIDLGTLQVLPGMMQKKTNNSRIIKKCCMLIRNLTAGTNDQKKLVRDSGVVRLIVKYLSDDNDKVVEQVLCVFVNVTCKDTSGKQFVIDLEILRVLVGIMEKKKDNSEIIKYCCWLIRNVMRGTDDQKQAVINNGLIKIIVKIMQTGDSDCQYQCCWTLANLAEGTRAQIQSLMDEKPIPSLAAVLTHTDDDCIDDALYVILMLFSTANSTQLETLKMEAVEEGAVDHLVRLRNHEDEEVRNKAVDILGKYFA